ncbi:MAG: 3-carboxyethylcatechol 2,3-dioxygenase [Propionibacteriaceae bacterium]|nr:3-carboxyethylcatechol 2,3-dioxygenase [Propionibacteriaceae bacterium]
MALAVAAVSHAPSYPRVNPGGTTVAEIEAALVEAHAFIKDFDPEVVVVFGPDHFNGMLYASMAPWVVGAQAESVGDWDSPKGPIAVDSETARTLHKWVLEQGIDIARSERMKVDHGVMVAMELLFGKDFTQPIVPVFVNALGHPLTPMKRVRDMGEAFGRAAQRLDKRVLFVGSGGISHDPPIPGWDGAPAALQERLTQYEPTRADRDVREKAIVDGIQAVADGKAPSDPLNEEWDELLLNTFRSGDLTPADSWDNDWFIAEGGSAAHEMRSWLAAYAALSTAGPYVLPVDHYWAVERWAGGYAVQTAITKA